MKNKTMPNEKYMGTEYYQDSVAVAMKGIEIEMMSILTIFTTIDLSSNKFSGEIPNVIGGLIALHVLNLSHNTLTGRIPSHLGDLANLESLDLSSNQLIGKIPNQLTSLTFLEVLNLSWNHLDGPIPKANNSIHLRMVHMLETQDYVGFRCQRNVEIIRHKYCQGQYVNKKMNRILQVDLLGKWW
ncbi:receptor-like protein 18 [Actinidia eriantha]|uniref:receptor-like protein 18 n=1 Tax=Actinidia eriantha TaxID=165200 RepID=UPI002583AA77|nr:receptor-like protein 18 [Actinidia eriantha]